MGWTDLAICIIGSFLFDLLYFILFFFFFFYFLPFFFYGYFSLFRVVVVRLSIPFASFLS